ncbi:MAG: glycosyltransferase [Zoogloeaceae bacterium]|jgi:spore maturation protein CgeB|nr:glycosyltransferase [Zoogloeaceae bacterium]
MTADTSNEKRFLVLDGISGVPLGREIMESLRADGHSADRFDCLHAASRSLYKVRSACAKAIGRLSTDMEFNCLPRLRSQELHSIFAVTMPTHVLVIGFIYKFFDLAELRLLADEYRATLVLYDTDSCNLFAKRREFVYFIEQELPVYDCVFSFSQVTANLFAQTRGLNARHLPFGANPITLPDIPQKDIDVLFVGSGDLRRIFLLEHIRNCVTVFGSRWQRHQPLISRELWARITDQPVWGNALHHLLARSKIVLNITRSDFHGAETGVNLRIFEAVAAGCFLLTDHCDEIEDLFDVGKEIETYRSSRELADKARFYLKNEKECARIAQNGHAKFLACHTWRERIRQMFFDSPPG